MSQYCAISQPVLLNGEETLSLDSNIAIFEAVQKFILLSKRFNISFVLTYHYKDTNSDKHWEV